MRLHPAEESWLCSMRPRIAWIIQKLWKEWQIKMIWVFLYPKPQATSFVMFTVAILQQATCSHFLFEILQPQTGAYSCWNTTQPQTGAYSCWNTTQSQTGHILDEILPNPKLARILVRTGILLRQTQHTENEICFQFPILWHQYTNKIY